MTWEMLSLMEDSPRLLVRAGRGAGGGAGALCLPGWGAALMGQRGQQWAPLLRSQSQ